VKVYKYLSPDRIDVLENLSIRFTQARYLNDPFVDFNRAKYFASQWGSDFISIGLKGHVNSDSNLKFWDEGQLILQKLYKTTNH